MSEHSPKLSRSPIRRERYAALSAASVSGHDGVGFDREAVAHRAKRGEHLGLLGMTERARNAGGTFALDSRPGAGSRIEVRLPLMTDVEPA